MTTLIHLVSITQLLREDQDILIDHFIGQINHVKSLAQNQNKNLLIVCVDESPNLYLDEELRRFNKCKQLVAQENVNAKYVLDSTFSESSIPPGDDIVFVSLWRLIALTMTYKQQRNRKVNADAKLGLFLPGKIDRFNRIVLMKKISELQLLDKMVYSCYYSSEELRNLHFVRSEWFSDYNEVQWKKFTDFLPNKLDIENFNKSVLFGCGFPYDHNLYQDTLFSVVAESDLGLYTIKDYGPANLSEKIYRTMLNCHPFILVGNPGSVKKLENMGYKTFKEYMDNPDYNDIVNSNKRITETAKNLKNFSTNLLSNLDQVRSDCQHNINLVKEHVRADKVILNDLIKKVDTDVNLPSTIVDSIVRVNQLMTIKFDK
jgi:hypothetical protein